MAKRFRNSRAAGLLAGGVTIAAAFIAAEQFQGSDPDLPDRAPVPGGHLRPGSHLPTPMRGRETDCTVDANNYFGQLLEAPYRLPDAPLVPAQSAGEPGSTETELTAVNVYETRPVAMSDALQAVEEQAADRMLGVFEDYCAEHGGSFEGSTENIAALQSDLAREMIKMIDEQIKVIKTIGPKIPQSEYGLDKQETIKGNIALYQTYREDYERLLDELTNKSGVVAGEAAPLT